MKPGQGGTDVRFEYKLEDEIYRAKLLMLQQSVNYVCGSLVRGDIVEFGVGKAEISYFLALCIKTSPTQWNVPKKRLHLFDSFQGFPAAHGRDLEAPHVVMAHWNEGNENHITAQQCRDRLMPVIGEEAIVYEGWFKDTLKEFPRDVKVAMVHSDSDLYESTMESLDPLFDNGQISEGAVICFDNWMANRCSAKYGEKAAFTELRKRYEIESTNNYYSWQGCRFIIHGYEGMHG
jgi:O-methyltransferase